MTSWRCRTACAESPLGLNEETNVRGRQRNILTQAARLEGRLVEEQTPGAIGAEEEEYVIVLASVLFAVQNGLFITIIDTV